MRKVVLYRIFHPMRDFWSKVEPWTWPNTAIERFPGALKSSGEVWLDELSDSPRAFLELLRKSGFHDPCTSLVGFADDLRLGPYSVFQLRFREIVELEQEADNFAGQQKCGWPFPVMRYGVSGCGRGEKLRLKNFRFPRKYKKPRHDLFTIAPGPRLSASCFGVSRRALDAFKSAGLTGYLAREILLFDGSKSDSFEIEIIGRASAPLSRDGFMAEQKCNICGLFQILPRRDHMFASIGPFPDIFSDADLQICTEQMVGEIKYYADDWPPFASRKFISVCAQQSLSGLVPGAAGGSFDPVVTESAYRLLQSQRP